MSATARKRGKARRVGRPRSQKTCFSALIKSRALWRGRLSRQGQDGSGVLPARNSQGRPAFVSFTCGERRLFHARVSRLENNAALAGRIAQKAGHHAANSSADSTGAPSFSFPSRRSRSRFAPRRLLRVPTVHHGHAARRARHSQRRYRRAVLALGSHAREA